MSNKTSIVFVHGIWADGSSFSKLIPTLQGEGHEVIAAHRQGHRGAGTSLCGTAGGLTEELPFRLWKFGANRNGRVDIEFSEELTADWLKSMSDMIVREKQKVLDCFAARGYQGLR